MTWEAIYDCLDKFNLITGSIMFFVTLINLIISWKINSRINSAVDLKRLKDSKNKVMGNVKAIIRVLETEECVSTQSKNQIQLQFTGLRATYPDVKKMNQKKLLKVTSNPDPDYIQVIEMLTRFITELERIV